MIAFFIIATALEVADFSETREKFHSDIFTTCRISLRKIIFPRDINVEIFDIFGLKCPDNVKMIIQSSFT